MRTPVFYALDCNDIDLARTILAALVDDPLLLVDTDHGLIVSGPEFVDGMKRQKAWDWRRQ